MLKKAILTGSTGYVGSNLLRELLKRNWRVAIIVRKDSPFHYIEDIKNKVEILKFDNDMNEMVNFFNRIKPDVVFHLASYVMVQHELNDLTSIINSNILFGTQVLEAMARSNTFNIVNTGTSWQHFNNEKFNPVNLYAASKEAFFSILKYYTEVFAIRAITLELFDIYGPKDQRSKVLNLIKSVDNDKTWLKMTSGEQEINLVFIDDVVKAYLVASKILMTTKDGGINKTYSVRGSETKSLRELVELYEIINKTVLNILWGAKPYRNREIMTIWNKGELLPNWNAEIGLEEGLRLFGECE